MSTYNSSGWHLEPYLFSDSDVAPVSMSKSVVQIRLWVVCVVLTKKLYSNVSNVRKSFSAALVQKMAGRCVSSSKLSTLSKFELSKSNSSSTDRKTVRVENRADFRADSRAVDRNSKLENRHIRTSFEIASLLALITVERTSLEEV